MLYFSQFTADGPRIFTLKAAQWESLPDTPPKVTGLFTMKGEERVPAKDSFSQKQTKEFSSWPYMLPNHWIPNFLAVDRGAIFQAATTAGDPLGKNTLRFFAQWDTLTKKFGGSVGYNNGSYRMPFGVNFSDFYSYFYPTESSLRVTNASAFTSFRMPWIKNTRMSLRWLYSLIGTPSGANLIRQGPRVDVSYRNVRSQPWAISGESGWGLSLTHKNFLPNLGNTAYRETSMNLSTYWSSFTPGRSVLFLGVNGSYVPASDTLPGFFGVSTLAGPFNSTQQVNTAFLQRGYGSGAILARQIVNINTEFRFPLANIFWGFRSPPAFLNRIYGHLVFDTSTFRGVDYITGQSRGSNFDNWLYGTGLELQAEVSMFYQLPFTLTLGLYTGLNREVSSSLTPFFSIRL